MNKLFSDNLVKQWISALQRWVKMCNKSPQSSNSFLPLLSLLSLFQTMLPSVLPHSPVFSFVTERSTLPVNSAMEASRDSSWKGLPMLQESLALTLLSELQHSKMTAWCHIPSTEQSGGVDEVNHTWGTRGIPVAQLVCRHTIISAALLLLLLGWGCV